MHRRLREMTRFNLVSLYLTNYLILSLFHLKRDLRGLLRGTMLPRSGPRWLGTWQSLFSRYHVLYASSCRSVLYVVAPAECWAEMMYVWNVDEGMITGTPIQNFMFFFFFVFFLFEWQCLLCYPMLNHCIYGSIWFHFVMFLCVCLIWTGLIYSY